MKRTSLVIATAAALMCASAGCVAADAAKCSLLTRDEVEQAIGAHDGGKSDLMNQWGLQGCRWTAAAAAKGAPEGWKDSIEVAVFDPLRTSWAREQATGAPVQGIKSGKYDANHGELWFECAGNRMCVVEVRTASSKGREENARRLAQAMDRRVK